MPLTSLLISIACQNAYPNHQDACDKALEASSKSLQIYQTDEKIENYYTVQAKDTATDNLGKTPVEAIVGAGYTYRVYKNKSLDFKLPTLGLCDIATNHVTPNSYSVNLGWKFPWLK